MNVMKMILDSLVGQKRIDTGTQASGGIGRISSNTGKNISRKRRLVPNTSPRGIPSNWAMMNPASTRWKLTAQDCQ